MNSDMIYILSMARRYDDAIQQAKKTLEMDANWSFARNQLVEAHLLKGSYEEAIAKREKYVQIADWPPARKTAAIEEIVRIRNAYMRGGPDGFWRDLLESQKAAMYAGEKISPKFFGEINARLGNKDEAFKWLSKAIDEKENGIDLLKVHPGYDNLRLDPRFDALLRRMNLK